MFPRILDTLSRLAGPLLKSAPDPREQNSPGRGHEDLLLRITDARSRIQAVRTHLEDWHASATQEAADLLEEARRLVGADNEEAARVVLRRRASVFGRLTIMDEHLAQISEEDRILEDAGVRLESEITLRSVRYGISAARYDAAAARVTVTEVLSDISEEFSDVVEDLSVADERAADMEARADALDELVGLGVLMPAHLATPYPQPDVDSDEVERLLEQLRACPLAQDMAEPSRKGGPHSFYPDLRGDETLDCYTGTQSKSSNPGGE